MTHFVTEFYRNGVDLFTSLSRSVWHSYHVKNCSISNYIVTEGIDKILSKQFTNTYFACLKRVMELTPLKYTRSFVDILADFEKYARNNCLYFYSCENIHVNCK